MQKYLKRIIGIIVIIIVIPFVVGIGISLPIFKHITISNDWIGFWGSYIGTILGGMITLYVLWNTITDGERARKRDEKVKFFDKITELSSKFFTSIGDIFALSMRLISTPENELYRLYLQQINYASGISTELEILIESRKDIYDCKEYSQFLYDITDKINKINKKFDGELITCRFGNKEKIDEIDQEMNDVLNKVDILRKILTKCVKNNLY